MPLDKVTLKEDIVELITGIASNENEDKTPAEFIEEYATGMANLIDKFVRTGRVVTTGSSSAQTGHIE